MKIAGALFLLVSMILAFWTINNLTRGIHAGTSCYAQDSGNIKLGFFGLNKASILDDGCEQIEAARLAAELGLADHAKVILCSHGGSARAFSSEKDCLEYNGNYQSVLVKTNEIERYCYERSRKWYRKVLFGTKRKFNKCMRERQL